MRKMSRQFFRIKVILKNEPRLESEIVMEKAKRLYEYIAEHSDLQKEISNILPDDIISNILNGSLPVFPHEDLGIIVDENELIHYMNHAVLYKEVGDGQYILFKFNYTETIPSTISAFEIVNYLLDEKTVELVKSDLQHEVVDYTKDDQSYIIYRKIWKSKPQMTHYEKDYYEAEYIENCEIKKITRCNKLFEFEEIYSHKRLLEICSSNEFMMATWKLIDEKYIGDFDCHLYVITDATEIPIGLLYYHLFNDKFHISGFEVASTMRRLGIGTAIIKQFFNEYKVSSNDIFLEPLNKESEKFWKKLGIKCSLY